MNTKTAIIVCSHNSKDLTSTLCNKITINTKSDYELLVVETGSNKNELTDYPTLWVPDKIRMTRGFNKGIEYFLWKEKFQNNVYYDSFWLVVNDAIFENRDILTPMINFMKDNTNCGEIHPYFTENSHSNQLKKENGEARKEAFVEFVCPLFSRKAIEIQNLLDDIFFFGWGIDYEIPYLLHKNNLNLYVSNEVGVEHHPSTTVLSGKDDLFKTKQNQFVLSRENMIEGLEKKYGKNWGDIFLSMVPEDVSVNSFKEWASNNGDYRFNEN